MDGNTLVELLSEKNQIQKILEMNPKTERFGLVLGDEDVKLLLEKRKDVRYPVLLCIMM